jgi:hypothetical protein
MKKLLLLPLVFHASMFGVDWKSFFGFKSTLPYENDPLVQAVRFDQAEKLPELLKQHGIDVEIKNGQSLSNLNFSTNTQLTEESLEILNTKLDSAHLLQKKDMRGSIKAKSSSPEKFVGYCAGVLGIGGFFYLLTRSIDAAVFNKPQVFADLGDVINHPLLHPIARTGLACSLDFALQNSFTANFFTALSGYGLAKAIKGAVANLPGSKLLSTQEKKEYKKEKEFVRSIRSMGDEDFALLEKENFSGMPGSRHIDNYEPSFLKKFKEKLDFAKRKRASDYILMAGCYLGRKQLDAFSELNNTKSVNVKKVVPTK